MLQRTPGSFERGHVVRRREGGQTAPVTGGAGGSHSHPRGLSTPRLREAFEQAQPAARGRGGRRRGEMGKPLRNEAKPGGPAGEGGPRCASLPPPAARGTARPRQSPDRARDTQRGGKGKQDPRGAQVGRSVRPCVPRPPPTHLLHAGAQLHPAPRPPLARGAPPAPAPFIGERGSPDPPSANPPPPTNFSVQWRAAGRGALANARTCAWARLSAQRSAGPATAPAA